MAGAIRQPVDIASLERYLARNVPEIKTPIDLKQFGYGQSNPTYQITDSTGRKFVIRKKPPGKLLSQTAHKVEREYRIIHALENTDVPVPKAICLCEDDSVIGTAFYIMSFLDGRIFEDPALPGVSPAERTEMWHDAVRTLGKFHRINPDEVGLGNFGKRSGFYNRQIALFTTLNEVQSKAVDVETKEPVGKIPHFNEMVTFFSDPKLQPQERSTFVHGDYKIDNIVFHKTEPRVIGVLDWEMSTIGHPLSDLVNLLSPWVTAPSQQARSIGRGSTAFLPGQTPGLPTRKQLAKWYSEDAGWDPMPDLTWGDAFGIFRGSIIMQGIAARYALRQASSAKAQNYAIQRKPWAEISWLMIQELKAKHEKARL